MKKVSLYFNKIIALWVVPISSDLKKISLQEEEWAKKLTLKRARQFHHSRGCVRESLSELWDLPPLEIPLHAPPGEPPKLDKGWGYVSFSHCSDCLFIGWSPRPIGVDIEKANREFKINKLIDRLLNESEIKQLIHLNNDEKRAMFLKLWVLKEAAIKFHQGSIIKDFLLWNIDLIKRKGFHKTLGYEVNWHTFNFQGWIMAIALDKGSHNPYPIFCNKIFKYQKNFSNFDLSK